jgi:UDP-glucose 4-epimerase
MIEVKGEKFVVTGGAGFIGSHIAEELLRQGKEVVIIDNMTTGKMKNVNLLMDLNSNLVVIYKDVGGGIRPDDFKGVDVVFHNAAQKALLAPKSPMNDLRANAWGTFNVADCCVQAGVKKLIYASTGSVYGEGKEDWRRPKATTEQDTKQPISFYGVSKYAAELYLQVFSKIYQDFDHISLRYHHVYGPRQEMSPNLGGVIPVFINAVINKIPITIFGDGEQTRQFCYVKDVVEANFKAANFKPLNSKACRPINIAGPAHDRISIEALAIYIQRLVVERGYEETEIAYSEPRDFDIWNFFVDINAAEGHIDWVPRTPLEEGLASTIDWVIEESKWTGNTRIG